MNREIEFRAWLKDENRMITNISSIKLDIHCIYYDNNQMLSYERASFDDIELMQYTGLKDKNGVKIFEGDIVKNIYTDLKYKVFWDDENVRYRLELIDNDLDYIELNIREAGRLEVIGNIYENPELLEVKE